MPTAPKWLKIGTSNLADMIPGSDGNKTKMLGPSQGQDQNYKIKTKTKTN